MSSIKTILISQLPLPYSKIASWTSMYNYLLRSGTHNFDFIVCPKHVNSNLNGLEYMYLRKVSFADKVKSKVIGKKWRYANFIEALEKIIEPNHKYILHIVDNGGLVCYIDYFLKKKHNRQNFYVQYCYHGFSSLYAGKELSSSVNTIDEMIFLTNLSYKSHLHYHKEFIPRARVIPNGVDISKFTKVSYEKKLDFKEKEHLNPQDIVFMWCSQDRPKKGLNIILEAFYKVHQSNKNTKLLVIGADRAIEQAGVLVIGKVQNNELPKYYQMSDVYLFPTLWKEGFGLVLAEALNCGCYCIASSLGGVPEVMNFGQNGVLIQNPNFVHNWVEEMERAINVFQNKKENPFLKELGKSLYDIDDWCRNINLAINEAKIKMNSNK